MKLPLEQALASRCDFCHKTLNWELSPESDGPYWSAWCCDQEYYISVSEVNIERITDNEPPARPANNH